MLAPVIAGLVAWLPLNSVAWKTLASIGALAAFGVLLSHLARDQGKRKEHTLFAMWGGPPTTRFLRRQDKTLPDATKERYHARLATLIPGIELPSIRSERARPEGADGIYVSCVDWLREKTRNLEKFRLIFEENVGYGFRRNLWAMKPAGVLLSIVGIIIGAIRLGLDVLDGKSPTIESIIALAISIPLLVWWCARIRPPWVAQGADAYAKRLLAACEEL